MRAKEITITTRSPEKTRELGEAIGASLGPGAAIALIGDLGAGKTHLVQGLAKGLSVPDEYYITSPSYTLINEYPGRHTLFHVDLYRLERGADLEEIGLLEILYGDGVTAIEWADRLEEPLPPGHVTLYMAAMPEETLRQIRIVAADADAIEQLDRLEKELKKRQWD